MEINCVVDDMVILILKVCSVLWYGNRADWQLWCCIQYNQWIINEWNSCNWEEVQNIPVVLRSAMIHV